MNKDFITNVCRLLEAGNTHTGIANFLGCQRATVGRAIDQAAIWWLETRRLETRRQDVDRMVDGGPPD